MWYNFSKRIWEIDFLDYFLMSAFVTSLLVHNLHPQLRKEGKLKKDLITKSPWSELSSGNLLKMSKMILETLREGNPELQEELDMMRLKEDLISKSKPSPLFSASNSNLSVEPIRLYYKTILEQRGGDLEPNYLYNFVYRFQKLVLKLLSFLKNKELYANASEQFTKQVLYRKLISMIQLLLESYNITIRYKLSNGVGTELIAVAIITGGATGLVSAWLPLIRVVLGPTAIGSTVLCRSIFHQVVKTVSFLDHWVQKKRIDKILKDEHLSEELGNLIIRSQTEFSNSDKVKIQDLNWNRNRTIRETAQRLKVFQKPPQVLEELFLDTSNLDPAFKELFEKLGIPERPIPIPSGRSRPKAKLVKFSNFVRSILSDEDLESRNNSELLEIENILKKLKIR